MTTTTAPVTGEPSESPESGFRVVGDESDAAGDIGLQGPDHADAVRVVIEADRVTARVTVEFVGEIPERLDEGEVMGVGVDLHRPGSDGDSDYQVFADGGSDGWFAYLQTPDGFVEYPGRFLLAGSRMIWEVPWSSVGNLREGAFRAFADWSAPGVAVLYEASEDRVPDAGRSTFRR